MRKTNIFIFSLAFVTLGWGQTKLAIGDWVDFLPYVSGVSVTQNADKIFYSTEFSIIAFNKSDISPEYFSTIDGLSTVGKSKLLFHDAQKTLIAVYQNGVIDLITSDGVTTLKDIKNFDNIPLDKNPNALFEDSDRSAILSMNYGISKVDIVSQKILWSALTDNNPVRDCILMNGYYYAGTDDGLFRISLTEEFENFKNWEKLDTTYGLPIKTGCGGLSAIDDALYVGLENQVFKYVNDSFELIYEDSLREVVSVTSDHEHVVVSFYCEDGCNSNAITISPSSEILESAAGCANRIFDAIEDETGRIWYADLWNDFRYAYKNGSGCNDRLRQGTVPTANVHEVAVANNQVIVASGGVKSGFKYANRNDGYFILDEFGAWTVKSLFNEDFLKTEDLKNFHRVQVHPATGDLYLGTYWGGILVDHLDGSYTIHNAQNSTLEEVSPLDQRERITGMDFDQENNLWVTSFLVNDHPVSVLKNDGTWKGFKPSNIGSGPNEIAVDKNGFKWITLTGDAQRGVMVFDEGEMDVDGDENSFVYNSSNSLLPNNTAICVTVDLDGDVWVGTSEGPVVFECGTDVFDGACPGSRRTFEVEGISEYLLGTEEIRTIAVDGANRKWFGTKNGVFVLSPSGEEQVLKFNTDNSPILDNEINDIEVDPLTGTAYIGTSKGLVAYRSDAIAGGKFHSSDVVAYPNPVRPGYSGPIAIKGLPRNANVKITDVTGKLVFENEALGGQAIWDGKDYNGNDITSGVYLVFSSSDPDSFESVEALVTKILVIR